MRKLLSAAAVLVLAGLSGVGCAPVPPPSPAAVPMAGPAMPGPVAAMPPQLQPPPPASLLLQANARGAQIYTCGAKPPGGFSWSFKAPDAILFDAAGRQVAHHFAGPSWQANDGSIVVGETTATVPAPNGQGVPWLLLRAKAHQGVGIFSGVSYIQRVDTNGGAAPALPCSPANVDQEVRIPYAAVYVLYR